MDVVDEPDDLVLADLHALGTRRRLKSRVRRVDGDRVLVLRVRAGIRRPLSPRISSLPPPPSRRLSPGPLSSPPRITSFLSPARTVSRPGPGSMKSSPAPVPDSLSPSIVS